MVEARLAGGVCETLAWNGGGTSALRLELARCEAWLGAEVELPLSNLGGTEATGGVEVYANNDGSHANYADIGAESVRGDRPGALRLEVENLSETESLGDLITCLDAREDTRGAVDWLEGEDASGGSQVTQAGCSGGVCRQVEISSQAVPVLTWELDGEHLARLGGREARPVVRFASPPTESSAWAWWQVRAGAQRVWETERDLLSGEVLQIFPALPIPPLPLDQPGGLALELWTKTGSGTASFSVDWAQLCPLDGWRAYHAVMEVPPGGVLVEDGYAGQVFTRTAEGEWPSHTARGRPLALRPGRGQRVYLLRGGSADMPLRVKMWYRPAWGSL